MSHSEWIETDSFHQYNAYIISCFLQLAWDSRLRSKHIEKLQINDELWSKEWKFLIKILYWWKECLTWNFSKMWQIDSKIISAQKINMILHEAWQVLSFSISKNLTDTVIKMLNEHIKNKILKSCQKSYRNSWFLIKKKSEKYQIINMIMSMNKVIIRNANLLLNCKDFIKDFVSMTVSLLLDFYANYD